MVEKDYNYFREFQKAKIERGIHRKLDKILDHQHPQDEPPLEKQLSNKNKKRLVRKNYDMLNSGSDGDPSSSSVERFSQEARKPKEKDYMGISQLGFAPKNIDVGAVYAPKSSVVQQRIRRNNTFTRKETTSPSKIGGLGVSVLDAYSGAESPMKVKHLKHFSLANMTSTQYESGHAINRKVGKRTSMNTNKSMHMAKTFGSSGANKKPRANVGGPFRGMGQMSGKRPSLIKSPAQSATQPGTSSVINIAQAVVTKI